MFKRFFTRSCRADLERYVYIEYQPSDRAAALEQLLRETSS